MLILPIEQAEPGMRLVMTVTHPEQPDQELLKPGFVLDKAVLERLRKLGVPFVYVDYPDLADLDRHLLPYLSPARQRIYSHVKNTIAAVQKTARPTVTFPDYYAATRDLVIMLLSNGELPIYMDLLSETGSDAVRHSTTVAHLAVTIGIRMEQYIVQQRSRLPARHAREVVNLGVAGMLHDIGKAKLGAGLQEHTGLNPPQDPKLREEWESHPQVGADMLRHGVESSAVAAVLQHHQHYDESGFPPLVRRGKPDGLLAGDHIHVFGRIILAADLYDRLALAADGKRRRPPIEILHLMRSQHGQWLDPVILKTLPKVIPPLPPGSRLTLSDGTHAVVTVVDPERPYCPTVRRLDADHLKLTGDPITLTPDLPVSIRACGGANVEPILRAALAQAA